MIHTAPDPQETIEESEQEIKLHRLDPRRKALLIGAGLLVTLGCSLWTAAMQVSQSPATTQTALAAASILALLVTTAMIVRTSLRITQLEFWIRRMGGGDLEHTMEPTGHDEFTEIAYDLEVLRQRSIRSQQLDTVRQLSEELEDKNQALEQTLQELHDTQDQMISRQKLAEIGELAAGIAHEVRNPLNIMSNFAGASRELMEELQEIMGQGENQSDDQEETREILQELGQNMQSIENNCDRASRIIQDVTNMSRSGSGQKRPVEVNKLLHDYTMLAYQAARSQDREFNLRIVEDLDEQAGEIVCIPEELSRVFINMASNACYATRKKLPSQPADYQPTLWVSTDRSESDVTITLRDNGTGIPRELVQKIFNPFFTTKPTNEGTGLGLSLSHEIVRQHGGAIEVQSEPGQYTQMRITIPLTPTP